MIKHLLKQEYQRKKDLMQKLNRKITNLDKINYCQSRIQLKVICKDVLLVADGLVKSIWINKCVRIF